jgi:hypothetical protein
LEYPLVEDVADELDSKITSPESAS